MRQTRLTGKAALFTRIIGGTIGGLGLASMHLAQASVISATPTLPLLGVPYVATTAIGCIAAADLCVGSGSFTQTSAVSLTFGPGGQIIVSDVSFSGIATTDSGSPLGPINLSGTLSQNVVGRTTSTETGSWTDSLVDLSLSGPALGHTLTLTLDPASTSAGTTSITPIGGPPATSFEIASFFDVFTELSLDSTPPLKAAGGPVHLEVPMSVAEPSGLLIVAPLLAMAVAIRRRIGMPAL